MKMHFKLKEPFGQKFSVDAKAGERGVYALLPIGIADTFVAHGRAG